MHQALLAVLRQAREGIPLEHIEAFIDAQPLDSEFKAVLWIIAWTGGEPTIVATELGRTESSESLQRGLLVG